MGGDERNGSKETRHTISIVGSAGFMGMVGYDWVPLGVDFATHDQPKLERHVADAQSYDWQQGGRRSRRSAWSPARNCSRRRSTRRTF